jgi:hypothetical protein
MAKKKVALPHLLLHSTNTWLAFKIAEKYYGNEHWVWCTPYFDSQAASGPGIIPPTSCPSDIYHQLWREVKAGDRHSTKVEQNKLGLLQGAAAKRKAKIITPEQEEEVAGIVKAAQLPDFKPLLFIIPVAGVTDRVREVPIADKAHPLSAEYIIPNLPRRCFDIIELRRD